MLACNSPANHAPQDADDRPLIVHVVYSLRAGGLENGLVNLVNALPCDRYRHTIICLDGFDSFRDRIRNRDVSVLALQKKQGQDLGAYVRLWQMLRELRPTIVHTRTLGTLDAQLYAVLAGKSFRVHGEHGRVSAGADCVTFKQRLLRRVVRPWIDHYIAVSKDLQAFLREGMRIPALQVSLIYNGVDVQRFHPRDAGRPEIGPAGLFAHDSIVIGTVGRMHPVKDQLTLVRAFLDLRTRMPELRARLRLALVGDGPLLMQCRKMLEDGNAAELTWLPGERVDIPEILRLLDVFVLPSLSEGTSNTILEAMATGLPVVATDVGGNPELITSGETGCLVPPDNPRSMSEAIARYCEDACLRRRHGQAARAVVEQVFSLESMVRGYQDVYDGLLTHRPLAKQVTPCAE